MSEADLWCLDPRHPLFLDWRGDPSERLHGQSARYFIGTAYHEHERALAAAGALSFAHEHLIGPVSGKGLQGITRGLQP
eukprot:scaffold192873_cov13-Tisochrysis_lutea.AAC.1